jgi:outer membrane protein assembly factor BamB
MKILALSMLHIAVVMNTTAGAPPGVLWTYSGASDSTPGLGPDGTIYIAGAGGLHAVAPTGTNKWIFPRAVADTAPAIATDGTVYFGSYDGNLYAVNPNGTQRWAYTVDPTSAVSIGSNPALGPDGTVYFAAQAALYALSPDGTKKWSYYLGDVTTSSPVVGADGTVYIGSQALQELLALSPDGNKKWELPVGDNVGRSPAIAADGTIYFTTGRGGFLYAVSPGGTQLWHNSGTFLDGSPSLAKDGTVYIGSIRDLGLFAFNSSGATNWEAVATGSNPNMIIPTTPAIDARGLIYYAASNSLFAIRPDGGVEWTFTSGPAYTSPTIGPDGTIYVGLGCCLYALQGTNRLATSAWPKFRQNLRNTGKVERPALNLPQKRSDGGFQFELQGELGQGYTVSGSTNLNTWTSLTSFVATIVPMDVVDFTATNFPVRFYRASSP